MKSIIKNILIAATVLVAATSCTKDKNTLDAAANTAAASASTFALTNRVLSAFVVDSSSVPGYTGTLPTGYNKFRKLLTYDTFAVANKVPAYNVGDVVTVLGYMKGDNFAITNRKINVRFFQTPTSFVTPLSGSVTNVMQKAEDSYRGFAPATADVLATVSLPAIAATTTAPFTVLQAAAEKVNGIDYTTYLIQLTYIIPASFSGKLVSVNLTANTAGAASDLGNVNWIYAFRVK